MSNDAIWDWDLVADTVDWSDGFQSLFGHAIPAQNSSAEACIKFIHPEDLDRIMAGVSAAIARRATSWSDQYRFVRLNGSYAEVMDKACIVYDGAGKAVRMVGAMQDVSERKYRERLSLHERGVLEVLASGRPLIEVLTYLVEGYEELIQCTRASLQLLDETGTRLHSLVSPNIPVAFSEAIEGAAIGPSAGSCGTAAFRGEPVLVADIANDPLWADYKDLALNNGLRACWSMPIKNFSGGVLGTLAFYRDTPHQVQPEELSIAMRAAYLAGLAIERAQAETALRDAAEHTQAILDNMVDGVVTINAQGIVESFNKAASEIFGYRSEELIGQHVNVLIPVSLRARCDEHLQRFAQITDGRSCEESHEVEAVRRDGSLVELSLSVSRISRAGKMILIGLMRDITQHRRDVEEIRRLAFFDPLTGLPNRRLLFDRLQQALVTSARTGAHGAVMLLDLDHFKQLNDTQGHDVGDLLLQQVAKRLQACLREGDSVARLGGDEFVVLLEALSSDSTEAAMQAELIAYKILGALGRSYTLREGEYVSTPSLGIVIFLKDDVSLEDLLKKADVAMYQAKAAGRNTARFFDPAMQAIVAAHIELGKEMTRGLAEREFVLHYQIQVDASGKRIGAEALVRWQHAEHGCMAPAQFVPLAEDGGFILPLGQWVLEHACAQLRRWADSPLTAHWTMAVNVSAVQLAHAGFVANVKQAIKQTGADPSLLKLELTESMLVADMEGVISKMKDLRDMGVNFALDDFGTGYSSLSYLKRLPLDQLKIDQSFVRDLLTDPSDAVIARTIVALGHSLGLSVIAEGVETEGQRDFLASIGCDAYQGFYFGRPMLAEHLA